MIHFSTHKQDDRPIDLHKRSIIKLNVPMYTNVNMQRLCISFQHTKEETSDHQRITSLQEYKKGRGEILLLIRYDGGGEWRCLASNPQNNKIIPFLYVDPGEEESLKA